MKASDQELGALHGALAKHFVKELETGELTPAMLNTIRQFLRDNNINSTKEQSPEMGQIADKVLPFADIDPEDDSVVPFPVRS